MSAVLLEISSVPCSLMECRSVQARTAHLDAEPIPRLTRVPAGLITSGGMCALNTWGTRRRAATNLDPKKEHSSQIDFILLGHDHVDPTARMSPWREGGKHQALAANFGIPAFYAKAPIPKPQGLCRSTLREALRKNTPQAHAFEASLQTALSQASLGTASELTRVVYDCCAANVPARAAPKALQAWQTPESRLEVKHL